MVVHALTSKLWRGGGRTSLRKIWYVVITNPYLKLRQFVSVIGTIGICDKAAQLSSRIFSLCNLRYKCIRTLSTSIHSAHSQFVMHQYFQWPGMIFQNLLIAFNTLRTLRLNWWRKWSSSPGRYLEISYINVILRSTFSIQMLLLKRITLKLFISHNTDYYFKCD